MCRTAGTGHNSYSYSINTSISIGFQSQMEEKVVRKCFRSDIVNYLALFLFNFFKVYHFHIEKLLYKVTISCSTQADISSRRLVRHAADDDLRTMYDICFGKNSCN